MKFLVNLLVSILTFNLILSQVSKRHTYIKYSKQDLTLPSQEDSHELEIVYSTTKFVSEKTLDNFPTLAEYLWKYSTIKQLDGIEHEPMYNGCKTEFTAYPLFMINLDNGIIGNYWNKYYVAWMANLPAPTCTLNFMTFTYKVRFFNTLEKATLFYTQLDGNIVFKAANDFALVGPSGFISGQMVMYNRLSGNIGPC